MSTDPRSDFVALVLKLVYATLHEYQNESYNEARAAVVAEYERVCQIVGEQQVRIETDTAELAAERQRVEGLRAERDEARDNFRYVSAERDAARLEFDQLVKAKALLRPINDAPPEGCYCPPDKCGAPVIMGRQMPCRRNPKP